jgi:hypothetical protein
VVLKERKKERKKKKTVTMDKVQKIDTSNSAPSSKHLEISRISSVSIYAELKVGRHSSIYEYLT